jgi:PKD repeat protein
MFSRYRGGKAGATRLSTNRFLNLGSYLVSVSILPSILVMNFLLLSIAPDLQAAEITLAWDDPNNDPAEVDTYTIYYWQPDWEIPASESAELNLIHTLSDLEPSQPYKFAVTVGDPNGPQESLYSNIVTATLPAANFSAEADANDPLTVNFTDGSSGMLTNWDWDFGDGNVSTDQNSTHTYDQSGSYTVTLTVTGPEGSDTANTTITVGSGAPTAGFTADPTTGSAPLTVTFTDTSSGNITSWAWDFGDGNTSTAQHPAHTYNSTGSYTVTLMVTGPEGNDVFTVIDMITVHDTSSAEIHIADLDGSSLNNENTWTAGVTITVHDTADVVTSEAEVHGTWSEGNIGSGMCTTDSNGQCSIESGDIRKSEKNVTFTIENVTHSTFMYQPTDNHDDDENSDGVRITVGKP